MSDLRRVNLKGMEETSSGFFLSNKNQTGILEAVYLENQLTEGADSDRAIMKAYQAAVHPLDKDRNTYTCHFPVLNQTISESIRICSDLKPRAMSFDCIDPPVSSCAAPPNMRPTLPKLQA